MRLALAIEGGFRRSVEGFAVAVEPQVGRVLMEFLEAEVLILPPGDDGEVGLARLRAVDTGDAGQARAYFDVGRPIGAARADAGLGRGPFPLQLVADADFSAIVAAASGGAFAQAVTPGGEIGELAVGFESSADNGEAVAGAVIATLRRETGNRCAATGLPLPPDALPVAIRWEGPERLHLNNLLLLSPAAEAAFRQGHFTARDDFSLIVDLRRIDPELLEQLDPGGRLHVPDNSMLRPSAANLAWHRRWVFGLR